MDENIVLEKNEEEQQEKTGELDEEENGNYKIIKLLVLI